MQHCLLLMSFTAAGLPVGGSGGLRASGPEAHQTAAVRSRTAAAEVRRRVGNGHAERLRRPHPQLRLCGWKDPGWCEWRQHFNDRRTTATANRHPYVVCSCSDSGQGAGESHPGDQKHREQGSAISSSPQHYENFIIHISFSQQLPLHKYKTP